MNWRINNIFFIFTFILFFHFSWAQIPQENEDVLEQSNQFFAKEEKFRIQRFCLRSKKKFESTGTGLFFYIQNKGKGAFLQSKEIAILDFKVRGLDGKMYYQNPIEKPLEIAIDHSDFVSGLHEGLKKLQIGSEAIFILPSHLAHGLLGDRIQIPPRMPIIWELKVMGKIKLF